MMDIFPNQLTKLRIFFQSCNKWNQFEENKVDFWGADPGQAARADRPLPRPWWRPQTMADEWRLLQNSFDTTINRPTAEKLNKILYKIQLKPIFIFILLIILFNFSSEARLKFSGVSFATPSCSIT